MGVANRAPSKPRLFDAFELGLAAVWASRLLIAGPWRPAIFSAGSRFSSLGAIVGGLKLLVSGEAFVFALVLFSQRDQVVSGDGQRFGGLLQPVQRARLHQLCACGQVTTQGCSPAQRHREDHRSVRCAVRATQEQPVHRNFAPSIGQVATGVLLGSAAEGRVASATRGDYAAAAAAVLTADDHQEI